jgi:hypothetical protein
MISLTLSREPEWLDLTHGVTVLIRPLTAAIFSAARADLEAGDLIDAEAQEIAAALVKAIARRTILSWEGVGDADGTPVDPDDATVDALFDLWPIYEAFNERFIARWLLLGEEGNGSAPSPTGTLAGVLDIAPPAPGAAPTVLPG